MVTLGKKIKQIREKLKLNQAQFAQLLGFESPMAVSHYEKDKRVPDLNTLVKIAEMGNVSLDFFTGKEPEKPQGVAEEVAAYGDPEITEILHLLKESPHDKKLVLKLLKARKEMKEALEGLGGP